MEEAMLRHYPAILKDNEYLERRSIGMAYEKVAGYEGGILAWIATPVFFSSYWVATPYALVITLTIICTALEDRTLQEELSGYREYTEQVRFCLLPGI